MQIFPYFGVLKPHNRSLHLMKKFAYNFNKNKMSFEPYLRISEFGFKLLRRKTGANFDCDCILWHFPSSKFPKLTYNSPKLHTLKYIKYKKVFRARYLVL